MRNIENTEQKEFFSPPASSGWIQRISEAVVWLEEMERDRLELNVNRPNTNGKALLDRQPLLGNRTSPDWLRNLAHRRAMMSLDTFQDNFCLWRSVAVYKDARTDRSTEAARRLAWSFFGFDKLERRHSDIPLRRNVTAKTSLDQLDEVERFLNHGKLMKGHCS